ncbi:MULTISPECIES: hypothetical protein [Cupriavidus]
MGRNLTLKDGQYVARCKERTFLAAAANGHSIVFPEADVVVSSGLAKFYKGGKEIWSCNVSYAAANFEIEKA